MPTAHIAALATFLILCATSPLQLQEPAPRPGKARRPPEQQATGDKAKTEAGQRGTDCTPVVVKLSPSQVDQIVAAQKSEQRERESASEGWTAIFTGGMLLVAILQAGLFVWQLRLIRKANNAAVKAADAARDSADLARNNAVQQLRAYLTRTSDPPDNREVPGADPGPRQRHRFEFGIGIKNAGATPAYKVDAYGACEMHVRQVPPDHDVLIAPTRPSNASLGPGQRMTMLILSEALKWEQVQQVKDGSDFRLFVFGIVKYEDAFGHPRCLKFREEVEWRGNQPWLSPTEGGNESD